MQALQEIPANGIDLVISSYELTTIDGETFYKKICEDIPDIKILFIGSTRDEEVITNILLYPNCDYMVQPIVPTELLARIKVFTIPENGCTDAAGVITIRDLTLDSTTKRATRGKKEIILTPTEFSLLQYLMENAGAVLSRDMILNRVWKTTENVSDRVVDVYIGYLREKIDNGFKDKLLETVVGFGYKINK